MNRLLSFLSLVLALGTSQFVWAQLYDGNTLLPANLDQLVAPVTAGSILILGESHGLGPIRDQHMQILQALRAKGLKISVGLEFLNYTDQPALDQYRAGQLTVEQFLSAVKWSGYGFEFYKPQLTFPEPALGEFSIGLNLPRAVASQISKGGVASLTPDEQALMPPNFELGRDSYKQRFWEAAGEHCPNFEFCFAAQSSWDDTMAWTAAKFMEAHPEQVLVIVVGEFHAQFGGGLADRISHRLPGVKIEILSQIWADGFTDDDIKQAMQPSPVEGPRGDFIWVSKP